VFVVYTRSPVCYGIDMQETLPMRFVGYVRVSTDEQARSGLSIQAQRERLAAWATAFGHDLVEVVADEGESAKTLDRPGMQRVLRMIDRRQVDGVVAAKLDRLTRSSRDLGDMVDRCERRGVALASVSESLDTSTACGRMVVSMIGAVAQWEREAIAERTAAALAAKRRQGLRYCGRAPYGFGFDADGSMQEDADEQATLDRVEELARHKQSLRDIGRELAADGRTNRNGKPFTASSVKRLLFAVKLRNADARACA
jgi:site-specific DNA recombinase